MFDWNKDEKIRRTPRYFANDEIKQYQTKKRKINTHYYKSKSNEGSSLATHSNHTISFHLSPFISYGVCIYHFSLIPFES